MADELKENNIEEPTWLLCFSKNSDTEMSEGLDDDGNACFFDAKNSDTEMPAGLDNLGIGIQPADVDNQPAGLDNLPIRIQPAGLKNLGNTCFLNAVLQCLTHTAPFVRRLRDCNHTEVFCLGISPSFQGTQQQDAHELLRCMLKRLQWDEGASFVNEIFGGCLRSQLQCTHCLHVSETFDPILDLSLAIEGLCDLSAALESLTRVEEMRDVGPCEKCKEKFPFERRVTIDQAPEVAVLHLKRSTSENKKINNFVKYPLELDLQHFLSKPSGNDNAESKYDLYAVLVHHGTSTDFGHYFCFIRSSQGSWYILDDSKVTPVAEYEVLNQEAYILFYRRQESPWSSSLVEAETVSPGSMWMNSSSTSSVSDSDDLVTVPVQFQSSINGEFDEHTDAPSAYPPKPPISPGKHVESGQVCKQIPHTHSSNGEERMKPAIIVDDDDVQEDGKAKKQQKNELQGMSYFYSLFSCAYEVPNQCLVHFIVPFCIRVLKQLYSLFHIFHIF
ncbi:Ubiquitin carboxyl-terminal hydrolases family 2 [Cinnamomum micranthum f. kanehirae]|uniref:Ubiquitin carboxyl-terminal hydrolase n=1 Tax=Cinnamomum micranthum f. kanehirae TaxID=337451 RepID=A0A443P964_9MAGN|nr:Ubiquitin carboxyl-terminal hydrolases family 2 [Cinnamomum micranthum f. kanehirae]